MHVAFIFRRDRFESLHDFMFGRNDLRFESSKAVTLELAADQCDIFFGVQEAERRTVNRNQPAARLDIIEQRRFRFWRNALDVCKNQQARKSF